MNPVVFEKLAGLAFKEAGIYLSRGKETLLASRISKRIRALGLSGEEEYLEFLENDPSGKETAAFLDAISTNFTSFMRERDHFDLLSRWAKGFLEQGGRRARIWCAAAATGEEPYSIAITLLEAFEGRHIDFRILATDISRRALAKASQGIYPGKTLQPLSSRERLKYFTKAGSEKGEQLFAVKPVLKERILFRRLNLAKPPYPMKGPLDLVFCRNVMIYFKTPTRQAVVGEVERLLAPGGLFVTGHSDTLTGVQTSLVTLRPSVYRKPAG